MTTMKVLTGGGFNHIHSGHIKLLKKCKKLGFLIVIISNDSHNKRPNALPALERKKNLEASSIPDKVIIGDPDRFVGVLERENPDIIVLGHDQKLPDEETEQYVKKKKIEIVKMKKFKKN